MMQRGPKASAVVEQKIKIIAKQIGVRQLDVKENRRLKEEQGLVPEDEICTDNLDFGMMNAMTVIQEAQAMDLTLSP